jgi:hypothetical protein
MEQTVAYDLALRCMTRDLRAQNRRGGKSWKWIDLSPQIAYVEPRLPMLEGLCARGPCARERKKRYVARERE